MIMTIGKKLMLGFVSVVILTIVVGLVSINILGRTNRIWKEAKTVGMGLALLGDEVEVQLLQARRSEKDFKLRYKEEGIEKAKEGYIQTNQASAIKKTQEALTEIKKISEGAGLKENAQRAENALVLLEAYRTETLKMVSLIEKKGYIDTGIIGKMRGSIRQSEEAILRLGRIEIDAAMLECRRDEKDFLLREEVQYVDKHKASVETLKAKIRAATFNEAEKSGLLRNVNDYQTNFLEVVNAVSDIDVQTAKYREDAHAVEAISDEIEAEGKRLEGKYSASALALAGPATTIVVVVLVLVILLASVIATVITRGITNPIRKLVNVSDIIAKGDLTPEIEVKSNDEIGQLAGSFKQMVASLREMIKRVLNTAGSVSASSQQLSSAAQQSNASVQQISSTIQQLARGSQTQAQRVEETANVMEQLNTSVSQSAQSSQQAAAASAQSSQSAQKGAETVKETVSTMDKIFDSTNNASEVVKKLGERSEQMNKIVDVMTSVADQTNLLALNASIEAARAGEAGRGFAVVAEEVGKLAENSAKSASEIGELIKETSKDTDEAVKSMENTFTLVSQGKEVVTTTSKAIEEIQQASENVSSMLQQISAASQQMSSGAKQVVKSVDEVASIAEEASASTQQAGASSQQMVATMQEMASSAQSLAQMGIELNEVVSEFKTDEAERIERPQLRAPRSRPALPSVAERLVNARMKMAETRRPELSATEEKPRQEESKKKNMQET